MKLVGRYCFVPGCMSGDQKNRKIKRKFGIPNGRLFKAKNEAQIRKWRKAIPRKDKVFRRNDAVCELHFNHDDIIWYHETELPNGVVDRIARGRPILKDGAVPTIFPNLPENLSKEGTGGEPEVEDHSFSESGMKESCTRTDLNGETLDNCQEITVEDTELLVTDESKEKQVNINFRLINCAQPEFSHVIEAFDEDSVSVKPCLMNGLGEEMCEAFNMAFLMENIKNIMLPSAKWTVAALGGDIIFLCFAKNFLPEKILVVMEDLSIKVMIENKEIFIEEMKAVENMDDLIKVIGYIDVLQVNDLVSED